MYTPTCSFTPGRSRSVLPAEMPRRPTWLWPGPRFCTVRPATLRDTSSMFVAPNWSSCSPVRALMANGTSCSDSARFRAVTVISPSAAGSSCAMALCARTSATAVATSDAGRRRMFLFMVLPLLQPVFPGTVVCKSVSALSNYRKSDAVVAPRQHLGGCEGVWGIGGPAGIRTQDQGIRVAPPFPAGADYLFTRGLRGRFGCGTLSPVIKGTRSPQVVSAPSGGAPPARLRIAISRSRAGRFP